MADALAPGFQDLLEDLTTKLAELSRLAGRLGEQHRQDILVAGAAGGVLGFHQQQQHQRQHSFFSADSANPAQGDAARETVGDIAGSSNGYVDAAVSGLDQLTSGMEVAAAVAIAAPTTPAASLTLNLPGSAVESDVLQPPLAREVSGMPKLCPPGAEEAPPSSLVLRELWTRRRPRYNRRSKRLTCASRESLAPSALGSCRSSGLERSFASERGSRAFGRGDGGGSCTDHGLEGGAGAGGVGSTPFTSPVSSPRNRRSLRQHRVTSRFLAALVVHPGSRGRLLWDAIGTAAVGYDLVYLPLEAFGPPPFLLFAAMGWLTTVFWTFDIFRTFFVGFHCKGKVEMRLSRIARRYATSWLPLDAAICSCDWAVILSEAVGGQAGDAEDAGSLVRMGRVLRIMRMARLLRVLKVHGMVSELLEHVQSESFRIFLGIAKLIVFIMFVNHILACGFYWMGTLGSEGGDTWIIQNHLDGEPFAYQYTTALHWSLTQFTPASMEVVPRNVLERTYTVCTVLFALVTFSSFVSSLTSAMTELRNLNSEKLEQCAMLRRYLRENRIDPSLMSRIWGWVEHKPNRPRRRTRAEDVAMLASLPRRLQVELHRQVYGPVLVEHPFFYRFSVARPSELRFVFECLHEVHVDVGHEVFATGQVATQMFFIVHGALTYSLDSGADGWRPPTPGAHQLGPASAPLLPPLGASPSASTGADGDADVLVVRAGDWLCEAALWFQWKHIGQLTAADDSELVGLNAARLHDLMTCELQDMWEPGKYARVLARYIEKHQLTVTDASFPEDSVLEGLASLAFDDGSECEGSEAAHLPSRRRSVQGIRCSNWSLLSSNSVDAASPLFFACDPNGRSSDCARGLCGAATGNSGSGEQDEAVVEVAGAAAASSPAAGPAEPHHGGSGNLGGRRHSSRGSARRSRQRGSDVLRDMDDVWCRASCVASSVYGATGTARSSFSSLTTNDTSSSHSCRSSVVSNPMWGLPAATANAAPQRRASVSFFHGVVAGFSSSKPVAASPGVAPAVGEAAAPQSSQELPSAAAANAVTESPGPSPSMGSNARISAMGELARNSILSAGRRLSGAFSISQWPAKRASRVSVRSVDGGVCDSNSRATAHRISLSSIVSCASSDSEASDQEHRRRPPGQHAFASPSGRSVGGSHPLGHADASR